jgi:hypothetical protein
VYTAGIDNGIHKLPWEIEILDLPSKIEFIGDESVALVAVHYCYHINRNWRQRQVFSFSKCLHYGFSNR